MDKSTAQRIVCDTFQTSFDRKRYRDFINELCNGFDESKAQTMQVPDAFAPHVKSCQRIGTFTTPENEKADVLIVNLTESYKLERTRTALRDFVAHKLKRDDSYKEAGLVAFVAPDSQSWRFSYVRMEYETKRDPKTGKIKPEERLTPARRYSYLVGADEKCHTAQSRFLALLQNTSDVPVLAQIEEAFSVESVTKEFFNEYARLFATALDALEALVKKNAVLRADFKAKGVSTVDFTKKLLGQIVFLYFIQKKGWLGVAKGGKWGEGPRNFLRLLADRATREKKCFFSDTLEPLFYDTLATDRGHDAWCQTFQCRIPFLNGGLFEPLAGYDWKKTAINLPNTLFTNKYPSPAGDVGAGILDVFDRYNFTVNEAEPLEKDVAIDPEMLGKVFEKLIEENRRKGLGAFYTPREIVHYMCQESLINYLDTTLNKNGRIIQRVEVEALILEGEQAAHYETARKDGTASYIRRLPAAVEKYAGDLDDALKNITVCDPAIGSGAFPVGMMTEIVRARTALNPYFSGLSERTPYHFKRHAIQNSLYGVDIDAGAVEIAKLRLWLSLVVDEEDVQQIKPLPNLDFKIVTGDSLLGFPFQSQGLADIETLKEKYFDDSDHERKAKLKQLIDRRIENILAHSEKSLGHRVDFDYRLFFSEVFREKDGFDVLMGNPPYIRIQNIEPKYVQYLKPRYVAASGKFDIYVLFVEAAFAQMNKNGTVCLIHPHRFLTAGYGRGLKVFLDKSGGLKKAVLFGVEQVFETATTYTGIFFYSRNNSCFQFKYVTTKDFGAVKFAERKYEEDGRHWILATETAGSTDLVVKLKSQARPLTDIVKGIYQGIVTVGDDIFVLRGERKGKTYVGYSAAANAEVEVEASLVKPLVKGEHIRRYGKLTSDIVIIYPHHLDKRGKTVPYTEAEMKAAFPLAYAYFKPFKKHLIEKKVKYKTNPKCWFSLHRSRDKRLFDGRKLITPQLQNMPHFTLDDQGWYPDAGGYSLVGCASRIGEEFLLGVLNSKVLWYFIKNTSNPYNNSYYYFQTKYLESFSVPVCSKNDEEEIAGLVRRVIECAASAERAQESWKLQATIDKHVYRIYGLTTGEIEIIEKAASW